MAEPLDPDTLVDLQRFCDERSDTYAVTIRRSDLLDLLAVARDHARLTAEVLSYRLQAQIDGSDAPISSEELAALKADYARLSAEAGDTDD